MFNSLILDNLKSNTWSLPLLAPYFIKAAKKIVTLENISNCDLVAKAFKYDIEFHVEDKIVIDVIGDRVASYFSQISSIGGQENFSQFEVTQIRNLINFLKIDKETLEIVLNESIFTGFLKFSRVNFRTASHPYFYGVVVVADKFFDQSIEAQYISLCHELGHQELFLINTIDRLVVKEFENRKVFVPLQGKERPVIGRLHSLFALDKMISAAEKVKSAKAVDFRRMICENLETFNEIELTVFGNKIIEVLKEKHRA